MQHTQTDIRLIDIVFIRESDALRLRHPPYPGISDLAKDIQARGQTTPLFVRPVGTTHFELISGYRRLSALKHAGVRQALVRVYEDLSDQLAYELAVSENQDRTDLTELEKAEICLRLQAGNRTYPEIAAKMGWASDKQVSKYLRLARNASPVLRDAMQDMRTLPFSVLSVFLDEVTRDRFAEKEERTLLREVFEGEYSASQAKNLIQRTLRLKTPKQAVPEPEGPAFLRELKNGDFVVNAKISKASPQALDDQIAALAEGLRRAKKFKRQVETEALNAPPVTEETSALAVSASV